MEEEKIFANNSSDEELENQRHKFKASLNLQSEILSQKSQQDKKKNHFKKKSGNGLDKHSFFFFRA